MAPDGQPASPPAASTASPSAVSSGPNRPAELLAELVKKIGREVGFDRVGIAPAEPLGREQFLRDWLAAGYAGEMSYLARNLDKRNDPRLLLPGARSVICLASDYPADPAVNSPVANFAHGPDYHETLKRQAHLLVDRLRPAMAAAPTSNGEQAAFKVCVDTVPLLERELAVRAGLGWIGKNTMLVHPQAGSFFLLAEIITTLDITPDRPLANPCAQSACRQCLDACPTGAIVRQHVLDASRCISYLTIELRGEIPADLRGRTAGQTYGCDRCQNVCPFNAGKVP